MTDEMTGCTVLPDGSAFFVGSLPLPKDHWLYEPYEWDSARDERSDVPPPILTRNLSDQIIKAARCAIRMSTMCGKETDFDPDAMVLNMLYALCGPVEASCYPAEDARYPGKDIQSVNIDTESE